ncbi:hypothetical protein CVT26_015142 [Gymnopilus dilepis]|uniref:Uncharacterized protein n=1 Tax=Gymnopilus dilepis TaxID=231916 RepID=A0A409X3Z6_9AGAR|nr:hypothetical protein CVT26_015142 [Gymnopilus dilepis]
MPSSSRLSDDTRVLWDELELQKEAFTIHQDSVLLTIEDNKRDIRKSRQFAKDIQAKISSLESNIEEQRNVIDEFNKKNMAALDKLRHDMNSKISTQEARGKKLTTDYEGAIARIGRLELSSTIETRKALNAVQNLEGEVGRLGQDLEGLQLESNVQGQVITDLQTELRVLHNFPPSEAIMDPGAPSVQQAVTLSEELRAFIEKQHEESLETTTTRRYEDDSPVQAGLTSGDNATDWDDASSTSARQSFLPAKSIVDFQALRGAPVLFLDVGSLDSKEIVGHADADAMDLGRSDPELTPGQREDAEVSRNWSHDKQNIVENTPADDLTESTYVHSEVGDISSITVQSSPYGKTTSSPRRIASTHGAWHQGPSCDQCKTNNLRTIHVLSLCLVAQFVFILWLYLTHRAGGINEIENLYAPESTYY